MMWIAAGVTFLVLLVIVAVIGSDLECPVCGGDRFEVGDSGYLSCLDCDVQVDTIEDRWRFLSSTEWYDLR